MSLEKMDVLEVRVRQLVDMVQELQRTNTSLQKQVTSLQKQVSLANEELSKRETCLHEWELERERLTSRIEKVIGELDGLELADPALEEVADGKAS